MTSTSVPNSDHASNVSSDGASSALATNSAGFAENASTVCTLIMITLCLCGAVGNAFSFAIYYSPSFRRRSINILLAALSASDLCLCLLSIPVFSITQIQRFLPGLSNFLTGHILLFAYPVAQMLQSNSVWLLVCITVDRYIAVCHPFRVLQYCTLARAKATVCAVVLSSVLYNLVRFWEFTVRDSSNMGSFEDSIAMLLRSDHLFMLLYQSIATNITLFFVPLLVHAVLNLQVARAILQASDQRRDLVASEKREFNIAKMMLFVVLVFIFCYTFGMILNVTEMLDDELFRQPIGYLLNDICNTLIVINSSTSFIFYVKFSTRFRAELRNMQCIRLFASRCQCCFSVRHSRTSRSRRKRSYAEFQRLTIASTTKCTTLNDSFCGDGFGRRSRKGTASHGGSDRPKTRPSRSNTACKAKGMETYSAQPSDTPSPGSRSIHSQIDHVP